MAAEDTARSHQAYLSCSECFEDRLPRHLSREGAFLGSCRRSLVDRHARDCRSLEGRGASQPLNATSHWLHGDAAARRRDMDLAHTGVGLATHAAATVFWAGLFEAWMHDRPSRDRGEIAVRAVTVAALAAVVDYTVTPRRFSPGWELVLSKRAMAAAYAGMAAGFAATRL